MAPTPITLLDNSVDMRPDVLLRGAHWDSRDLDPKAVGAHLPLSKRNSTPMSCGMGLSTQYNSLKAMLSAPLQPPPPIKAQMLHSPDSHPNMHRRLDRSHSEPVRPQIQPQPGQSGSSRYKTELCRPFGETGFCKYGEKCQFAHGRTELRSMTRHPKYKTELCRTFHTTGLCGYGSRCHFIHNADERRGPVTPPNGLSSPTFGNSHMGLHGHHSLGPLSYLPTPPEEQHFGPTPPSSHHGSPSSQSGTFFGDSFSSPLYSPKEFFNHIEALASPEPEIIRDNQPTTYDSPPDSPGESLAGDFDSLSLSSSTVSDPPPSPPSGASSMDKHLRLPIFEMLTEVQ